MHTKLFTLIHTPSPEVSADLPEQTSDLDKIENIMNTTTILLCGLTNNGNVAATNEAKTERYILAKTGEILTGPHLQFPDHILQDRVTSTEAFPTVEAMLRQYAAQKCADAAAEKQAKEEEKARAERMAVIPFNSSFVTAERRIKGWEDSYKALHKDFAALKASPALLRKQLKKAEAAAEKEKELAAFKKLCEKTLAPLKAEPKSPLKGLGYERVDFPSAGNNKKLQILIAAIPNSHKDEIASRRQKGYFGWSTIISPEASAKIAKLLPLAQ